MKRRVVITGIGIKSPIGNSLNDFQKNLFNMKSGIKKIDSWDNILGLKTKVAGIVPVIDEKVIPRQFRRSMDRVAILATLSCKDAISDANLNEDEISSYRTGIAYGSTVGGGATLEKVFGDLREHNSYSKQSSMDFLKYMSNTVCANLSSYFKIKGVNLPICSACTSSSQAIGLGYELIRNNISDKMICGGSEGMHHSLASIFDVMGASSTAFNDVAEKSSRPFDKNRDGFIMGEGAGALVLETLESAQARGAKIYAELIGFGESGDANHITTPTMDGPLRAMKAAYKMAKKNNGGELKVDYVNAHGTSTPVNDKNETAALKELFGGKENCPPVTSTKGQIGHCLGAAGAIEAIISITAMNKGIIPPTINQIESDENCDLDYVPNQAREANIDVVMSNSFGVGGTNGVVIFKKI
jgi:3-oxoacyl-[acyl-carrier-protein] synthase II